MRMIPDGSSPGHMLATGEYCIGRCIAHPNARPLAGPLEKAQDGLRAANAAFVTAENQAQRARAENDHAAFMAHGTMSALQLAALAWVKRDYRSPDYLAIFPGGVPRLQSGAARVREEVPRLLHALKGLPAGHPLAPFHKELSEAQREWEKPARGLEEAELSLQAAQSRLRKAKDVWLDTYDALAGSLRAACPRNRGLVASFFPQARRRAKAVPVPAPQGTGAGAGQKAA